MGEVQGRIGVPQRYKNPSEGCKSIHSTQNCFQSLRKYSLTKYTCSVHIYGDMSRGGRRVLLCISISDVPKRRARAHAHSTHNPTRGRGDTLTPQLNRARLQPQPSCEQKPSHSCPGEGRSLCVKLFQLNVRALAFCPALLAEQTLGSARLRISDGPITPAELLRHEQVVEC